MADPAVNPFAKYAPAPASAAPSANPFAKYAAPAAGATDKSAELGIGGDKGSFGGALAHGATFGLSDEIESGLAAPVQYGLDTLTGKNNLTLSDLVTGKQKPTLGDYYDANLANIRHGQETYAKEHPVLGTAGEVLGGALDLNPEAATTALAKGLMPAIRQGAALGAGMGAASGFGDESGGIENRLKGAALGGATGGIVGGAAPVAIPWALGASRDMMDMVSKAIAPWHGSLDDFISSTAGRVLNETAGPGGAHFAEAPLKDMALTTGQASDNPGMLWLERSLEQGSPEGARAAATSRTANNQAITKAIGDIGDLDADAAPAMRNAVVRSQPEESAADQVLGLARQHLGGNGFYDTSQSLNAARKAQSAPLYEEAMNNGPVISDRVNQFVDDPILKQGISQGLQIQRLESLAKGEPFDPKDYGITGFNDAGDPIISGVPNMRLLDAGKKGLDNIVEQYRNPITGKLNLDSYGNAVNQVRAQYVNALDDANPAYKAARAAWSGPSQSLDALNAGRNIFHPDSELTAQRIASLSPGDLDYHNVGVMRAIEDVANNSPNGASALNSLLAKPNVQDKLSAAFGSPEGFDAFQQKAADILNPQSDIGKVTSKNNAGAFTMPDSGVSDQFIRSGKGGPEAFNAYLDHVGDDPEGLQAARDAFAQKFLDQVQTTLPDHTGTPLVSASKVSNFLDNYDHVVQSKLFNDDQRDLIQRIADAADMSQRVARAGAKGGSDTYAKLSGKTFLDVLIGPGASKLIPAAGAVAGHFSGVPGGAIGGYVAASMGESKLESLLYGASRDKVMALVQEAINNPPLAKSLMETASSKAALKVPPAQRRLIYSILGYQFGKPVADNYSPQGQAAAAR